MMRQLQRVAWIPLLGGLLCAGCATPTTRLHFDFEKDAATTAPPFAGTGDLDFQVVGMDARVVPRLSGLALNFRSQAVATTENLSPFVNCDFVADVTPNLSDRPIDVVWTEETSGRGTIDVSFSIIPADDDLLPIDLFGFSLAGGEITAKATPKPATFHAVSPPGGGVHTVLLRVDLPHARWTATFLPDAKSLAATAQESPLSLAGTLPAGLHLTEGEQLDLFIGYHLLGNAHLHGTDVMDYYLDDVSIRQENN